MAFFALTPRRRHLLKKVDENFLSLWLVQTMYATNQNLNNKKASFKTMLFCF